ncbi:S-adenosylmethionine transporter [Hanseniaspora osmophila]|uniref:Putative mitochondrial carrier protein PET8 n=1 Tax=Hanseniaspora osmophila TaxID=56408 RepID=A0A1E5RZP9_9ASCO|nr:putative mitochondrial carrier protein PET8 [Hanseniaspora osmophila]
MNTNDMMISLLSGACAGTSTDLAFFPIDTIKTRLQAKGGFFHNGGYKGIYRGLGSCVIASAPSASLFFVTYDSMKTFLKKKYGKDNDRGNYTLIHMVSSSLGEISACLVRVPAEVIKQKTQTTVGSTSWKTFTSILHSSASWNDLRLNLYRGWSTTIMREIPFTCIQFPLYEYLKAYWKSKEQQSQSPNDNSKHVTLSPLKGAMCGSIAGAIAASLTTPLDVLKTRIMLSTDKQRDSLWTITKNLYKEEGGIKVFFKGVGPRTMWISAGGAIFLGVYETVHAVLDQ